jgi:hypothetical protein
LFGADDVDFVVEAFYVFAFSFVSESYKIFALKKRY